jgi:hypothetical protein
VTGYTVHPRPDWNLLLECYGWCLLNYTRWGDSQVALRGEINSQLDFAQKFKSDAEYNGMLMDLELTLDKVSAMRMGWWTGSAFEADADTVRRMVRDL